MKTLFEIVACLLVGGLAFWLGVVSFRMRHPVLLLSAVLAVAAWGFVAAAKAAPAPKPTRADVCEAYATLWATSAVQRDAGVPYMAWREKLEGGLNAKQRQGIKNVLDGALVVWAYPHLTIQQVREIAYSNCMNPRKL